jgi:formylglycine-generating enzyme required for sulfatase activity
VLDGATLTDGGVSPSDGAASNETASGTVASAVIPAGTFLRGYDGVSYTDSSHPATISSYSLDRYEVTVGRFRTFVSAVASGWRPQAGSGRHAHLNDGQGLAAVGGGFESGWDPAWTSSLAVTAEEWTTNLSCSQHTWTASPGPNEELPINCVDWFDAYAFCIWDSGFLPSETEWNYAASGGDEQRVYPWSVRAADSAADCTYANYDDVTHPAGSCAGQALMVGSLSPKGDGKWGQADLAGNLREWTLDRTGPYADPCVDCTRASPAGFQSRVALGGAFDETQVEASRLDGADPSDHPFASDTGFRCARSP